MFDLFGGNEEGGRGYPYAHYNLCGEIVVMVSVGETDLERGLRKFDEITTYQCAEYNEKSGKCVKSYKKGSQILQDRNQGTSGYTLTRFYDAYGWDSAYKTGELDPGEMADLLREDKDVLALVNINTGEFPLDKEVSYGEVISLEKTLEVHSGEAAHWVKIQDVIEMPNGETYVRVYNPIQNREELYSWETFKQAWAQTKGNNCRYGYVVAEPPPECAGLS
jgi:hypothetical protein